MDNLTKEQRHKNMVNIKSKDTSIEVCLRKALWERGMRYRKNYDKIPGKPDIALTKYKIAIFCDSEFFHGKDWEVLKPRLEKSNNSDYWIHKISRNMERDDEVNKQLLFMGWTVIRFWGKDILKRTDECVKVIEEAIFDNKVSYDNKTDEKVSEKKAYRLACSLQKIIGAPLWEKNIVEGQVCDGCSYELQITYTDKRKEVINGDVAGGMFDSILEKFVHSVFP